MTNLQPKSPEFEPISTVVIPTAGAGSRLLSMTSYLEKALIPVNYDQPVVNYSVEDAVRGGAKHIIFIASERGKVQLNDKYGKKLNADISAQLRQVGKDLTITDEEASRLSNHDVSFDYIVQPAEGEYGTTVPLFLAKNELKGITRFGYFMGDDFTYNRRGFSEFRDATRDMISHPDADHLAMAQRVSREEAIKYGIFYTDKDRILQEVKEKPRPEQVPEHPLANISKYILKNNIWSAVDETMTEPIPEEAKGERQFTRTMSQARLDGQTILIHPLSPGTVYRDGGTLEGLRSTSEYVRTHPRVDPQPLWK